MVFESLFSNTSVYDRAMDLVLDANRTVTQLVQI